MKVAVTLLIIVVLIGLSAAAKSPTRSCVKKKFSGCKWRPNRNRCTCGTARKCKNPFLYKTKKECKRHNYNVCKQLAPCRNGGVCVVSSNHFKCHCTGTGFYGKRCDKECPTPDRRNTEFWKFPSECIEF